MSEHFIRYLEREHDRLETLIAEQHRQPFPDERAIARLQQAKLLVKEQIERWQAEFWESIAA